jgi:hypothetical protein
MPFAGTAWTAATSRSNPQYSHTYDFPTGSTFAGDVPTRVVSTAHDPNSYRNRVEARRTQYTSPRTWSEKASANYSTTGVYTGYPAKRPTPFYSGEPKPKSSYHEAAQCGVTFENTAARINQLLLNNQASEAKDLVHDCAYGRIQYRTSTRNITHENLITIHQNLYSALQQLGDEANGATCTFRRMRNPSDPGDTTYYYVFILQKGGDSIYVSQFGVEQSGGGKKRSAKKTRKANRKQRKTRKERR